MRNWAELPEEILDQFLDKLSCVEDFVKFSAVCKPWKSVVHQRKGKGTTFSPWLMLINSDNDRLPCKNNQGGNRLFYNIHRNKSFNLILPQTQGRKCWGSSYGWLVTVGLDLGIDLLNPLSGVQIPLPPQLNLQAQSKTVPDVSETDPAFLIRGSTAKLVLTSNPSFSPQHPPNCLVMAIFGMNQELAFTNPLSQTWTSLESSSCTSDVIFYNGQVYCVRRGYFALCDTSTVSPKVIYIAKCPVEGSNLSRFYLLEMSGHLLLVVRYFKGVEREGYCFHYETEYFDAFKFDFTTEKWIELDDLGDHALFVGNNTSFAISTATYPEFKSNCVFCTDDHSSVYFDGYCDMGVYDYQTAIYQPFEVRKDVLSKFSRSCFFMPSM